MNTMNTPKQVIVTEQAPQVYVPVPVATFDALQDLAMAAYLVDVFDAFSGEVWCDCCTEKEQAAHNLARHGVAEALEKLEALGFVRRPE